MEKIRVSIIIVNYKVKKELFKCLNSIYNLKPKTSFEIIVVDNDEIKSIGKEIKQKFPKVKYIESDKNIGFGAGNNLGAKKAVGKYLFFLNPDTVILKDAISNLSKFLDKNKNAGIVSPIILKENLEPFSTQGAKRLTPFAAIFSLSFLKYFFPRKSIFKELYYRKWDMKTPREVNSVPGAALMISKKLFDKVKGFDEQFFLYFEENDISNRVNDLGYKLFIVPESKIVHKVAQSTKYLKSMEKIYNKSRFLYFKKYYGIFKALLIEGLLRLDKTTLVLLLAVFAAVFLRFSNISNSMQFIGDQGWFYLSARDLLTKGEFPLVGITTSHTWLHQGPLWTYMLAIALFLGNFNPVSGAYLTALLGVTTAILIYKLGSELFSKNVGLMAAALYAVSPLIVFFDRIPFDPAPIPLFTLLYFYCIYKWLRGQVLYFPLIIIFLAILYNLELATFSLFFPLFFIFLYGIYRKKSWVKNILNKKIIFYSILGFIISMFPIIIYDFSNGFKQTIVFLGWVFIYKPFSFLFKHSQDGANSGIAVVVKFLLQNIQRIVFEASLAISLFLFSLSLIMTVKDLLKKNNFNLENPKLLLLIFLITSIGGILINKSPSDAYLPITFPLIILLIALFFDYLISKEKIRAVSIISFFLIVVFNSYTSFKDSQTNEFTQRVNAADKIIGLSNGREYNLVGKGLGSQFESFTTNYEYLLWWKGHPPVSENVKLKIIVSETQKGIIISKE